MSKLTIDLAKGIAMSILAFAAIVPLGCFGARPDTGVASHAGGAGVVVGVGAGSGGSVGGAVGSGGAGGADADCTSTRARTGAACTEDCVLVAQVGIGNRGTRNCSCLGGAFSSCIVLRPEGWAGAAVAPCCSLGSTALATQDTPCDTEWQECITSDAVAGTTYQGCACLKDPTTGTLGWACASTFKWFTLDLTTTGGATTCL